MRDDNAPTTPSPGRARAAAFAASLDVPEPPAGRYVTDLAAAGANERRVRREKAAQLRTLHRLLMRDRPKPNPEPAPKPARPALPEKEIAAARRRGASVTAIARTYGVAKGTISRVLDRHRKKCGVRCGVDPAAVVARWRMGESMTQVADYFCIGESTARRIVAERTTREERHARKSTNNRPIPAAA